MYCPASFQKLFVLNPSRHQGQTSYKCLRLLLLITSTQPVSISEVLACSSISLCSTTNKSTDVARNSFQRTYQNTKGIQLSIATANVLNFPLPLLQNSRINIREVEHKTKKIPNPELSVFPDSKVQRTETVLDFFCALNTSQVHLIKQELTETEDQQKTSESCLNSSEGTTLKEKLTYYTRTLKTVGCAHYFYTKRSNKKERNYCFYISITSL